MKDIFVGNLDYTTSEDELRQLFAAYGPVDRASGDIRSRDEFARLEGLPGSP
jgi:RNA recognition motif-containing protein